MSKPCVCHFCGAVLSEADAHEFDERIMCKSCLEEYTTHCDCCLDRLWRAEAEGNHIGDCGTMLGPGYCGHLLFSLHNITDDIIVLKIGETFGSLTFDYLKTPVVRDSATVSSHLDKLLGMNLDLSTDDKEYFSKDWKVSFVGIKKEMIAQEKYKVFKIEHPENLFTRMKEFLCVRNIILITIGLALMIALFFITKKLDQNLVEKVWVDRYFDIVVVAVFGVLLTLYGKLFKK